MNEQKKIRVFVVDDQPYFTEGSKVLLEQYKDIEVTGTALNGPELFKQLVKVQPDVILLDIEMPSTNDGIDGFQIAEKDLELRGAGDIYGIRQSGLMDLKIANPIRDSELLEDAQKDALEMGKNEIEFAKVIVDRWIGNRIDYSDS